MRETESGDWPTDRPKVDFRQPILESEGIFLEQRTLNKSMVHLMTLNLSYNLTHMNVNRALFAFDKNTNFVCKTTQFNLVVSKIKEKKSNWNIDAIDANWLEFLCITHFDWLVLQIFNFKLSDLRATCDHRHQIPILRERKSNHKHNIYHLFKGISFRFAHGTHNEPRTDVNRFLFEQITFNLNDGWCLDIG